MAQRTGVNRTAIDSVQELKEIIAERCFHDESPKPEVLIPHFLAAIRRQIKNNYTTLNTKLGTPEKPENVSITSIFKFFDKYFADEYEFPIEFTEEKIADIREQARQIKLEADSIVAADKLLEKFIASFIQPEPTTDELPPPPPDLAKRIRQALGDSADKQIETQLMVAAELVEGCTPGHSHNVSHQLTLPPELQEGALDQLGKVWAALRRRPVSEDEIKAAARAEAAAKLASVREEVEQQLAPILAQSVKGQPPFLQAYQDVFQNLAVLPSMEVGPADVEFSQPNDLISDRVKELIPIVVNRLVSHIGYELVSAKLAGEIPDYTIASTCQNNLASLLQAAGQVVVDHQKIVDQIRAQGQDKVNGKSPETAAASEVGGGETAEDNNAVVPQLTPEEKAAQQAEEKEGLGERKQQLMKLHELQEKLTNVAEGALVDELVGQGFTKDQATTIAKEHRTELAQQLWARLLSEGADGDLKFSRAVLVMDGVVQEARQLLVAQHKADATLGSVTPLSAADEAKQAERLNILSGKLAADQDSINLSLHQLEANEYKTLLASEDELAATELKNVLGRLGVNLNHESDVNSIIMALRAAGNGEYLSRESLNLLLTGLANRDQVTLRTLRKTIGDGGLTQTQYDTLLNFIDRVSDEGLIAALANNPLNHIPGTPTTLNQQEIDAVLDQLLTVANGQDFLHIAQQAQRIAGEQAQKEDFLADALFSGQWWQQLSPDDKAALLAKLRFNPHTSALLLRGNYQSRRAPATAPVIGQPAVGTMKLIQDLRTDPRTQASFVYLMQIMNDESAPPAVVANFSTHMYLLQEGYISYNTFVVMVQGMLEQTADQMVAPDDGHQLDWRDPADQATLLQQSSGAGAIQQQQYLRAMADRQAEQRAKIKIAGAMMKGPAGFVMLLKDKDVRQVLINNAKRLALGLLTVSLPPLGLALTILALPQIILNTVANALGIGGSAAVTGGTSAAMGTMAGQVAAGGLQGGAAIAANAAPTVQAATSMGTHALTGAANNTLAAAQTALQTGMTQAASMTMTIPLVSGIFIGGMATLATLTIIVITVIGGSLNDLPMGTGGENFSLLPAGDTACIEIDQTSFLAAQNGGISPTVAIQKLIGQATKFMQSPRARALCTKLGGKKLILRYVMSAVSPICQARTSTGDETFWGCGDSNDAATGNAVIIVTNMWLKKPDNGGLFTMGHEFGHILQQNTDFRAAFRQGVGVAEIPTYWICDYYGEGEWQAEALGLTLYLDFYASSGKPNPYACKASPCSSSYTGLVCDYDIRIMHPEVVQFLRNYLQ